MHYNPEKKIIVFLGPSLDKSQAKQLLDAEYYPPARMGDIYRIIGSGVRVIALIDGVFHGETPVWQRELLEAIENKITVIGASSMGALRAAELHPFGMKGYGTIFEWYRDGIIDGDDEVALNHGDVSSGFKHLSEPLVNIRFNLMRAEKQEHISREQCLKLTEYAKSTYYVDRSYQLIIDSSLIKKMPLNQRERFIKFIKQDSIDLKKQDAVDTLKYCANTFTRKDNNFHAIDLSPVKIERGNKSFDRLNGWHRLSVLNRGFLNDQKLLVSGEKLIKQIFKNGNLVNELAPMLIKNYYLLLWTKRNNVECPSDHIKEFMKKWRDKYTAETPQPNELVLSLPKGATAPVSNQKKLTASKKTSCYRAIGTGKDYSYWLSSNGLTEVEFESELKERALLTWMIEKSPDHFGLNFKPYTCFVEAAINGKYSSKIKKEFLAQASGSCFLSAWAKESGITCPSTEAERYIAEWEKNQNINDRSARLTAMNISEETYLAVLEDRALAQWIIEKEPHNFGFISWSLEFSIIRELQISGRAAQLITQMSADCKG